ncbi:MAG: DUF2905 family protein [Planctomycetales bacterium]|nr:DUF2905 family protein [Planctomycetales bacterium]
MQHPGWILVTLGVILAGVGLIWLLAPGVPWLGRLPGDVKMERENFRFYFPLMTCLLLSVVLSVLLSGVMWLVRFWTR